jgi:hypothetical protein
MSGGVPGERNPMKAYTAKPKLPKQANNEACVAQGDRQFPPSNPFLVHQGPLAS